MPPSSATPSRAKRKAAASPKASPASAGKRKAATTLPIGKRARGKEGLEAHGFVRPSFSARLESAVEPAAPVAAAEEEEAAASSAALTAREERVLRAFDLCQTFGPMIGPTRMQRWRRAERFGLKPPTEVYDILAGRPDGDPANACCFSKYPL